MEGVNNLVDTKLNSIPKIDNERVMNYQPQTYYNAKCTNVQII